MTSPSERLRLLAQVEDKVVALSLESVRCVLPMLALARVPGAPPALLGIANLRGEPIPVLELRELFGLGEAARVATRRIVVGSSGERTFGIAVDDVLGVSALEALRDPLLEERRIAPEVVGEIALAGGEVCLVVDTAALVRFLLRAEEKARSA